MTITQQVDDTSSHALVPTYVQDELTWYEEQIAKYRSGELDETKMQKVRLHFGTYAQRQEGVQMQRIKIPGGYLTADQLEGLADASDRFGSSFIHFTTREDAQIYYVSLDETPTLLRFLADNRNHNPRSLWKHSQEHYCLLSCRYVSNRTFRCAALCGTLVSLPGPK